MNNNFENNNNSIEKTSVEYNRRTKIVKGLTVLALSFTILLSGCQVSSEKAPINPNQPTTTITEPTEQPISTENPIVIETPEPTPEPTPTVEVKPEIIGVPGINGELFSSVPTWEQDFSSSDSDIMNLKNNWNILIGPAPANKEAQYYTNSLNNLRIADGNLVIEAQLESMSSREYTSARISTEGRQDFMYGKFEIIAKLPSGVGTWPAVWLYPSEYKYAKMYQDSNFKSTYVDGELDIIEAVGSEPHVIYGIAHSIKNPDNDKYFSTIKVPNNDKEFHEYGLEWTPTNLTFTVDGKVYYEVNKKDNYDFKQWPYDQKYNLIMNLAMGGNWAGMDTKSFPGDGIDKSALPAKLEIQSVKYYEYVAPPVVVDYSKYYSNYNK